MNNSIYYLNQAKVFTEQSSTLKKLKEGYIRVKHLYCGLCGSDLSHYNGTRGKFPISLGHEFISEVIEINSNKSSLALGDLVVSDFNYRCNKCEYCQSGQSHLCIKNDIQFFSNRAFSEFSDIHFSYLYKVNNLPTKKAGTLVEPLSCVYHALQTVAISPESKILLVGCGNIGSLIAFYCFVTGYKGQIDVCDINDQKAKTLCALYGFSSKLEPDDNQYDVVFDASNHVSGLERSVSGCKPNGQVCSMSHHFGFNINRAYETIIEKEVKIKFPLRNGEPDNIKKAYQMIKAYWKKDYEVVFGVHDLSDINTVFNQKKLLDKNKIIFSIEPNC